MPTLPLAVDIADAVLQADAPLDTEAKAEELLKAHPEAGASHEEVRTVLEEESKVAMPARAKTRKS
ncbi:hypothetical protein [Chelativorans sp. AA-79]|uniref:hypothetical protein n=1 Tax=Chelativorans sp. AA-79 TaxID=3028735 RepID=UPI0023FA2F35|nr:hypothetical protein [Chelativorans sp. AA-79]WEX10583.1 hypothetical protein PVE73_06395 [Chelativorans sp. AA-79]